MTTDPLETISHYYIIVANFDNFLDKMLLCTFCSSEIDCTTTLFPSHSWLVPQYFVLCIVHHTSLIDMCVLTDLHLQSLRTS
jgi:hypothetical protein